MVTQGEAAQYEIKRERKIVLMYIYLASDVDCHKAVKAIIDKF